MPICQILQKFEAINYIHGRLSLDNIFINPSNFRITIGECFSELPFSSIHNIFIPYELIQCITIARDSFDNSTDYYSLGVICLYLLTGRNPFKNAEQEQIVYTRITEGSFNALNGSYNINFAFKLMLKGLINDKNNERWKSKQIIEWYNGQRDSSIHLIDFQQANRSLLFNNKNYSNTKILAYELNKNWDIAKNFIKEDKILKWVERGISSYEIIEKITKLYNIIVKQSLQNSYNQDELLTRLIQALDPYGAIRFRNFTITIEALPTIIAYGFLQQKNQYLSNFKQALAINSLTDLLYSKINNRKNNFKLYFNQLEKVKKLLLINNLGFGPERCLYELNPYINCQSELLNKYYINDLDKLIELIEKLAIDKAQIMDRHIAAFILNKLSIEKEVVINSLAKLPSFAALSEYKSLAILVLAQKETNIKNLKNIAKNIANNLDSITNLIKNKNLKAELADQAKSIASKGNLIELLSLIANEQILTDDYNDYNQAIKRYNNLNNLKQQLHNPKQIYEIGYRYGLKLSVIISYIICLIVLFVFFSIRR